MRAKLKIYHVVISDRHWGMTNGLKQQYDIQATGREEAIDQAARMFVDAGRLYAAVAEPSAWQVIQKKERNGTSRETNQLQDESEEVEIELLRSKYDRGEYIQIDRLIERIKGFFVGLAIPAILLVWYLMGPQ